MTGANIDRRGYTYGSERLRKCHKPLSEKRRTKEVISFSDAG